jgi:hypothetical protein
LVLLGDNETGSYWNHITGECLHGPLKGNRLETFPIEHISVKNALNKYPNLHVALSKPPLLMKVVTPIMNIGRKKGFLPPFFRKTMGSIDARLPEMTSGLGVIIGETEKFYTIDSIKKHNGVIQDTIEGENITVQIDGIDHLPYALLSDNSRPMQLFTRWYGFSLTYPNCKVF